MRLPTRPSLTFLGSILALTALAGCDPEPVLLGNFDVWPTSLVAGDMPGDPNGDTVFQFEDGNFAAARVFSDKLLFSDAACPIGQTCNSPARFAYFDSVDLDAQQRTNPFSWIIGGDAFIQPGCELDILLYHGHFNQVASIRFERPGSGNAVATIEHAGGSTVLDTLTMGDAFGYVVRADPSTDTLDVIGGSSPSDLPVVSSPTQASRGFFLAFDNAQATGCGLHIDTMEGHAEN